MNDAIAKMEEDTASKLKKLNNDSADLLKKKTDENREA
jgi:hypothetical protein